MKNDNLASDLYSEYLRSINGVKFTRREIDVASFILSGRQNKTISSFLSISSKTVEAHTRNMTQKLDCNSREGIINFIERAGKASILREYYCRLPIRKAFEKQLEKIAPLIMDNSKDLFIYHHYLKNDTSGIIYHLKKDLKAAGIKAVIKPFFKSKEQENKPKISIAYIGCATQVEHLEDIQKKLNLLGNPILLVNPENDLDFTQELDASIEICYLDRKNYYLSVFQVLKKLFPYINFENIIQEFDQQCLIFEDSIKPELAIPLYNGGSAHSYNSTPQPGTGSQPYVVNATDEASARSDMTSKSDHSMRATLWLPNALVERASLMEKINNKLEGEKKHIKKIALVGVVGIGGAGKTTLARQYAVLQEAEIIFEINAETKSSLIISFEILAYALAKSKEQKDELKDIQSMQESTKKEQRLLLFIQNFLRNSSNWVLIYDNMEIKEFSNIKDFLPSHSGVWGDGKVIITVRDRNIKNTAYIDSENIIDVQELLPEEALTLFTKIYFEFKELSSEEYKSIKEFLKNIPPFPLDVSAAAYYLKDKKISYEEYLIRIQECSKDFYKNQESLLKGVGEYTKTRYGIITASLLQMLESDELSQTYKYLLLLISSIDSQNIPVDLLYSCKNKYAVEELLHNLRSYSFITSESSIEDTSTFSLHRSTQEIIYNFLARDFLENSTSTMLSIGKNFEYYLIETRNHSNFSKMNTVALHGEVLLKHHELINQNIKAAVSHELADTYKILGRYSEAFKLFEEARDIYREINDKKAQVLVVANLGYTYCIANQYKKAVETLTPCVGDIEKIYGSNHTIVAENSLNLAIANQYIGRYQESAKLMRRSMDIYNQQTNSNPACLIRMSAHLGDIHRYLGKYIESEQLLTKALIFYQQKDNGLEPVWNALANAWIGRLLGGLYSYTGHYQMALSLLEGALKYYSQKYGKVHIKLIEILDNFARVYVGLQEYTKAKECSEKAEEIYKNNPVYEVKYILSSKVYAYLGDYNKSKEMLNSQLIAYKKYYGDQHVAAAVILNDFGQVLILEGNLEKAENLIQESLNIFQQNSHPLAYEALENLAELYLKKSSELKNKDHEQAKNLENKAKNYLIQARKYIKSYFPDNSLHLHRLNDKLTNGH